MRAHVAVLADVLEKCAFQSFTYLSSTRVYSRCESGSTDEILKVVPSDPSDLYNLSKLAGESLSLNCARPNTRVVRISNVVGHAKAQSDNFIDSVIRDAIKGNVLIRSAPESEKDYIALSDVVKAIPLVASAGQASIYNVASGSNTSNQEITELIETILGSKISYLPNAPILSFPLISISTLNDEFAFQPKSVLACLPDYIQQAMSTI
jgi:nucleoside-diphosphate-sugar epimerase